jgi:hypothetical protein
MAISKEQWQAIAAELKSQWVTMNFRLHGHEITIRRCRKSESTTVLGVYVDGVIEGKWFTQVSNIDPADDFMNKVAKQVFFHKFKAMYSKKELETMAKHKRRLGAKRMKEMFGEEPEKKGWTYLVPYFGSSTALVRQFKKIEGLELVSELKEVAA